MQYTLNAEAYMPGSVNATMKSSRRERLSSENIAILHANCCSAAISGSLWESSISHHVTMSNIDITTSCRSHRNCTSSEPYVH